ncbi:MAG TPA: antibiotic biosynthesis monooxygenase [Ktedonosporobacter sp.]|nr:antibiotic biosynthesis monooxygenase [Ktedonosporobacter sp.]
MYLILRRVNVKPDFVEESTQRIQQGLVPLVSSSPGFVAFYLVQISEHEGISITVFETREQAEEGNRKSLEWAKTEIFPLAQGPAEIVGVGEVLIHQEKVH